MARVGKSFFTRGEGTLSIPYSMHKDHRNKLLASLRAVHPKGCVFLKGGVEQAIYDTDTTWDFKQESNFQWLFGAKEVNLFGAVDVAKGTSYLFIPRLPDNYAQWYGPIKKPEWFRDTYEVDEVFYSDEIAETLSSVTDTLIVPEGVNHDSGAHPVENTFEGIEKFTTHKSKDLYSHLAELRVIKDEMELKILQFTNDVSSEAHIITMREAQRADRKMEYHSEAEFKYQSFLRGCPRVGYSCICPAGPRNATLHYGHPGEPNEHTVKEGDLKLHDMGAEYHGYTADITCTFPIGGKFDAEQTIVYNAVWKAVLAVENAILPGVNNTTLHRLAHRVLLEEMTAAGLFKGDIEEMLAEDLMGIFMPTGLGHQMGLDVHDVGGYEPGQGKSILADVKPYPINQNLRFARACQVGMVFTVEPGMYFNDWLIEKLYASPKLLSYVNEPLLKQFLHVGGVRIEDNIVVTETGCRVLTNVPRTVAEIEAVIAGEKWVGDYRVHTNK